MATSTDPDLTLPAVIASLVGKYGAQDVLLTIIFHPDITRIGHRAIVPKQTGNAPWILGRYSPAFRGANGQNSDVNNAQPLDDQHISRRALHFELRGKRLVIRRFESASRCRVGNNELYDSVELDWEQLRAGVPLLLGHSIVLLLRLGHARVPAAPNAACDSLLHGSSSCMAGIREQVARAADSDLDVLIRGETGTGKELVATSIHRSSRRADAPMVSVNMAAVPTELAAAALFGSARGAFTGADKASAGYFAQAEGGSLFLDEIGDVAPEVQPQLLRALQQREIQVVGGAIRRVDVRILSATDAALEGENSEFKAALRHRLAACEILLPPLREHPEDIGELLLHFLQKSAAETGRTQLLPHAQSPAPIIAGWAVLFLGFLNYSWPGNVRELANFAQQVILASDQFPTLNNSLQAALYPSKAQSAAASAYASRRKLQDISDDAFDEAMLANHCEIQRVARQLGVSRAAVYRRIEESPRYRLASDIPSHELQNLLTEHHGDSTAVARYLRVSISSLRSHLRRLNMDAN
jgi:DNA-binding NtrC family response regulator